jgi:hypothetical protein
MTYTYTYLSSTRYQDPDSARDCGMAGQTNTAVRVVLQQVLCGWGSSNHEGVVDKVNWSYVSVFFSLHLSTVCLNLQVMTSLL